MPTIDEQIEWQERRLGHFQREREFLVGLSDYESVVGAHGALDIINHEQAILASLKRLRDLEKQEEGR